MIVTGCNTSRLHPRAARSTASASASAPSCRRTASATIEEGPHRDNLRDIGRRYVDVTDLAFCVDYLERWGKRNAA